VKNKTLTKIILALLLLLVLLTLLLLPELSHQRSRAATEKIGVLLVSHGSKSKSWRELLREFRDEISNELLPGDHIADVKTAFMESSSPTIAAQLRSFDQQGFTEVIAVPLFLTVGGHAAHDIPNILGLAADPAIRASLKKENTEFYQPKARVTLTPTLDYQTFLQQNVIRRVKNLSRNSDEEAVVLVAYGSSQYNTQWEAMMKDIGRAVFKQTGIDAAAYAWCGHVVDYSPQDTQVAINKMLKQKQRVNVIPLLVSNNLFFSTTLSRKPLIPAQIPNRLCTSKTPFCLISYSITGCYKMFAPLLNHCRYSHYKFNGCKY